jgi:glycosyltransferase involved in cell wall biosynthesis
MVVKVLAIGDVGNTIRTLRKFVKKSEIHLINYPKDGSAFFVNLDGVELFKTRKVSEQVKRINQIKDDFDICLTTASERIAYLADLNYIAYYLGRDIDVPMFEKNSTESWQTEPLHKLNFFERKFYWNSFKNAVEHIAGKWQFEYLSKYTKNAINTARDAVDTEQFNLNVKPMERKKTKFTFFSPLRLEKAKGSDLLWKALKLCKSDFEILCVDWFGEATKEERIFKQKLIDEMPSQVKLIPVIKQSEIARYYKFADAVITNLFIGTHESVCVESVLCGTPVIQYTNRKIKIIVDEREIKSPFLPFSNDPKSIAEIIDKFVDSKEFRQKLFEEEYKFVKEICDPVKCGEWWDNLFVDLAKKHKSIKKNSSPLRVKLRLIYFLIVNRLYSYKLKRLLTGSYEKTGQTIYDNPPEIQRTNQSKE